MKERPISYSSPMVRARRAGLKTQTRRVVKHEAPDDADKCLWIDIDGRHTFAWTANGDDEDIISNAAQFTSPYGQPGDRLWVKEEHYLFGIWRIDGKRANGKPKYRFEVDQAMGAQFDKAPNGLITGRNTEVPGWYKRIGMFMPRWASRSVDEIVSVRVERLQNISEADARAEGITLHADHHVKPHDSIYGPVQTYRDLWEFLNGTGSWDENPWVWVIEFKAVTA